ncbi:MAG: glycoside hydrolase family 15 protein [Acidobacteriaceae bacterium]
MAQIEDYALIGDTETAALVGRDGSMDWLCWPNFASGACFAKLLGSEDNGFWRLAPEGKVTQSARRYEEHTLILETTHETRKGVVQVIDFMPPRGNQSDIVRIVRGLRGAVRMRSELALRYNYGAAVPWVTKMEGGSCLEAGPDSIVLRTSVELKGENMRTVGDFTVEEGESVAFVLSYGAYGRYHAEAPHPVDVDEAYRQTQAYWKEWAARTTYRGPRHDVIERSLLTLKALTYKPTGGIVAAPTTSLPEQLGGPRNWDYRYCWLRDTTFTLLALMNGGFHQEAKEWMHWLRRTIAGSPDQVQIMYGIAGERTLVEWEIPWLTGYENSKPVRVGNAAHAQLQLDIYGEVMDAFFWEFDSLQQQHREGEFSMLAQLVDHLETIWQEPDSGIWEVRGGPKHFTYSKVMAWVAFDRAVQLAERAHFEAPVARWKKVRDAIHEEVCRKGFNKRLNSFVQTYGSKNLDASLLLIAMVGFLPPDDPRIKGTVEAIERDLTEGGLVKRYDTARTKDGLKGGEGMFLACSFWMVSNLKFIGREGDAHALFERLLTLCNDVGLLSEEYDVKQQRLVGNFPQAFSHIALLGAAYHLYDPGHKARHTAGQGGKSKPAG